MRNAAAAFVLALLGCAESNVSKQDTPTSSLESTSTAVRGLQWALDTGFTESTLRMSDTDLLGTYAMGDGRAGQVSLSLGAFGKYSESTSSCTGVPIAECGKWSLDEAGVVLRRKERRSDSPTPEERRLTVAFKDHQPVLVDGIHLAMFELSGPSSTNCFRRMTTPAFQTAKVH